jgi:hypothetical protein
MKNEVFACGCLIGSGSAKASRDFLLESKIEVVNVPGNPRMWAEIPITFGAKRHSGLNAIRMADAEEKKACPGDDYLNFQTAVWK